MASRTHSSPLPEETPVLLIGARPDGHGALRDHLQAELVAPRIDRLETPGQIADLPDGQEYGLCIVETDSSDQCREAVERIRQRQPECPVLLILDLEHEGIAAQASRQGVSDYIIRTPEYGQRLRAVVAKLLQSTARHNEDIRSLQASARQFQELVENSAQGILIQIDDTPVYVNRAFAGILGYDGPEDILGLDSIYDFVDEWDKNRVVRIARRRVAGLDVPDTYVFRARRRDGGLIWLENRVNPVDWQGYRAVQCSMVDVSDRQRANNALRLAARVASRAGTQQDFEEAIEVVLRRLARGMGWELAESWLPSGEEHVLVPGPVWYSDRRRYRVFVESSRSQRYKVGDGLIGRVWESGQPEWIEDVSNSPMLFRRSILANAVGLQTGCGIPIVAHGRTVAVLCFYKTAREIGSQELVVALAAGAASLGPVLLRIQSEQARRESFAQTEALISENVDGILVVDGEDRILFANPAAEEAFGLGFEALRGMSFGTPALESGVAEIELRNVQTDATRMNEMRVAAIDWDGRPGRLISLRDVTERYETQSALERHRAALQERVKELRCLYTVSECLSQQDVDWSRTLQDIVDCLPAGWQYPDVLCARLSVEGIDVESSGFVETDWGMSCEVLVQNENVGFLQVYYTEEKPLHDIGPFLKEEQSLLNDIVRRIGQTISSRRYQQALDASRRRFRDFAEAASDWLWEMDEHLRFTYFSDRIETVMGRPVDHWVGRSRFDLTDESVDHDPKWAAHKADLMARRPFKNFRYRIDLPDGQRKYIAINGIPRFDENGEFRGYRGSGTDETQQVEARERARESDLRLQGIADGLPGIVFQRVRKPDGAIEYPYLSAGTFDMLGYMPEEFQQDTLLWSDRIYAEDRPRFDVGVAESERALEPMDMHFRMLSRTGETRWAWHRSRPRRLDNGDTVWDCIELDITEQKKTEARVQYLGYHDQLTGLPNRELFVERVNQVLPIASRNQQAVAVAMLGLKRFKQVNEEFGMAGGDEILRTSAERFTACLRPGDTVARLGGDRFLFLLPSVGTDSRTHKPFERLVEIMEEPFTIKEKQIRLVFNMGIAIFPGNGDTSEELIQKADTAQAHFSRWGPGFGYTFYQDRMPESDTSRLALEKELRDAIDSESQLEPYFQPIYSLKSGRLVAVETLARWNHPERGLVPPVEFIELAEDTGLIVPLGFEILRKACLCAREWEKMSLPPVVVTVNLSAAQIRDPDIAQSIRGILRDTRMPADRLALEVTESTLITNLDQATQFMEDLRAEGVSFALDDFGIGYSSLSYLGRLPVQALKIDRSFIRDLDTDPRSETTIKAIEALAHALELHVVAEGIETREQLDHIRLLGCDTSQGFYLGRPMPAADLEKVLSQNLPLDSLSAT